MATCPHTRGSFVCFSSPVWRITPSKHQQWRIRPGKALQWNLIFGKNPLLRWRSRFQSLRHLLMALPTVSKRTHGDEVISFRWPPSTIPWLHLDTKRNRTQSTRAWWLCLGIRELVLWRCMWCCLWDAPAQCCLKSQVRIGFRKLVGNRTWASERSIDPSEEEYCWPDKSTNAKK